MRVALGPVELRLDLAAMPPVATAPAPWEPVAALATALLARPASEDPPGLPLETPTLRITLGPAERLPDWAPDPEPTVDLQTPTGTARVPRFVIEELAGVLDHLRTGGIGPGTLFSLHPTAVVADEWLERARLVAMEGRLRFLDGDDDVTALITPVVAVDARQEFIGIMANLGLLSVEHSDAKVRHLEAWGCRRLVSYYQAVLQLSEYLVSPERHLAIPTVVGHDIPSCLISVDLFRDGLYVPPGTDPLAWAAVAESLVMQVPVGPVGLAFNALGLLEGRHNDQPVFLRWYREDGEHPRAVALSHSRSDVD